MFKSISFIVAVLSVVSLPLTAQSNIFTSDVNDQNYQTCVRMLDANGLDHNLWMKKCMDQKWSQDLYNTRICEVAQDKDFCKLKYQGMNNKYFLTEEARQDEQDAAKARGYTESGGTCYNLVVGQKKLEAKDFRKCVDEDWERNLDKLCPQFPDEPECLNYDPSLDLTTGDTNNRITITFPDQTKGSPIGQTSEVPTFPEQESAAVPDSTAEDDTAIAFETPDLTTGNKDLITIVPDQTTSSPIGQTSEVLTSPEQESAPDLTTDSVGEETNMPSQEPAAVPLPEAIPAPDLTTGSVDEEDEADEPEVAGKEYEVTKKMKKKSKICAQLVEDKKLLKKHFKKCRRAEEDKDKLKRYCEKRQKKGKDFAFCEKGVFKK